MKLLLLIREHVMIVDTINEYETQKRLEKVIEL